MLSLFKSPKIPKKINMGCGYDKRDGYLNVDSDPACDPDLLIVNNDISGLPKGHFEQVIALDVLEHIPRVYMMGALFDWALLLQPEGRIFVETSYIHGIIDVMREANDFETSHNWKICLFGNQVHAGDFHFNGFTVPTLRTYLRAVGLIEDGVNIRDRWLIQAWATKTEEWSDLAAIDDYPEFLQRAFTQLLWREPEPFRLAGYSAPNSPERWAEIKGLVCCEERLYKIGASLTELVPTSSEGPPVI
jgi:hypothetical protein